MPKHRPELRIDVRAPNDTPASLAADSADSPAPPAMAAVEAPSGLTLATLLGRSATTPVAIVNATWTAPDGYDASSSATLSYVIQWSTDSTFVAHAVGQAALQASASISGLTTGTLYYFRVAAVFRTVQSPWSASASITTAIDTTAPSPVTGASMSFAGGGDLVIVWTDPTSDNLHDVEVKIYESAAKVTTYATIFSTTRRLVWTVAQNLAATGGAGDPSLFVELRARSWGAIFSTIVSISLVTKAAPSAPTVTLQGYSQILVASITSTPESPTSLFEYVWKRDGSTRQTDLIADTSNTFALGAAGDEGTHSWTVAVRQRDAFGQYSSTTTSSAAILDTLTIAYLRAGLIFTDSVGNSVATLAVLKDGILDTGGVSYAA